MKWKSWEFSNIFAISLLLLLLLLHTRHILKNLLVWRLRESCWISSLHGGRKIEFHSYSIHICYSYRKASSYESEGRRLKLRKDGKKAEKENCRFTKFTIICLPFLQWTRERERESENATHIRAYKVHVFLHPPKTCSTLQITRKKSLFLFLFLRDRFLSKLILTS